MVGRFDPLDTSRRLVTWLLRHGTGPPPRFRAWTGVEWGPGNASSTVVLRHSGALRSLLVPPTDLAAGEAYVYDDIDIEGDIVEVLRFAAGLERIPRWRALSPMGLAMTLPREERRRRPRRATAGGRLHSIGRDRASVRFHYDTGNDFFETFLGPTMVYSCAYFLGPEDDLETAQTRKLDMVCRKLELRPDQHLLDVGCGWGSLVMHAATHYGVRATGVTLSAQQAQYARKRVSESGLAHRVTILECDYREIEGTFDAIASIGMVEHVGRSMLPTYFGTLRRLLAPGGIVLNHGIVDRHGTPPRQRRTSFVGTYVFPDGDLIPVGHSISVAEDAGFELRDVEALRMSYAHTLRRWVSNIEEHAAAARAAGSEELYRIWRLYMAGSAVAFERAAIGVDQLLLTDPARSWTFGRRAIIDARTSA